ncbi:hypothetical protein [Krasilnikovia sp. MM14-A1259]|uniref:hypothetical protein n=1 Tax=Krasilnikovia sp. MM14-A1259 TaxID=3373539 RepID=UPI0037F97A0C
MDGYVAGWTLLPDVKGPRAHHTDPQRHGRALCGRRLDPGAPVHPTRHRDFTTCPTCQNRAPTLPRRSPTPEAAPPRHPQRVDGRRLGWVQLRGQRVLHRPDPRQPDRVLCALELPVTVVIHRRPPAPWPPCPFCQQEIQLHRQEIQSSVSTRPSPSPAPAPVPRPTRAARATARRSPQPPAAPTVSARIRRLLIALPVLGPGPTGTAGTWQVPDGWVQLKPGGVWHRRHPERPDRMMCDLLPHGAPVYRRRTNADPACPDCAAVRNAALSALRAQPAPQRKPPARPPAPARLPRAQVVRGGLPGLGRDR